ASFDPKTQEMKVLVDGKDMPLDVYYTGTVSKFEGGRIPMRVGGIPSDQGGYRLTFNGQIAGVTLRGLHPQAVSAPLPTAQSPTAEKKIETVQAPFSFTLRSVGPGAYSIDAQNLPEGMSCILRRLEWRFEPSKNVSFQVNGIVTGLGADGTEWFSTLPYAGGKFVDSMLEIAVQDEKEKTLASTTVDVSAISVGKAATGTLPQITVQKTVAEPHVKAALLASASPTLRAVVSDGKVLLRAEGIPPHTTILLRGPGMDMRDIVLPPGNGEIALPIDVALVVSGKYTIQLVSAGKEIGQPQIFGPQAPVTVAGLAKGAEAPTAGEAIAASPQMQIIITPEGCIVRYQFLEEGSTLSTELMPLQNVESAPMTLPGTQGSLDMHGRMSPGWYRFLISGPGGRTVIERNLYVPESSAGVVITGAIVSRNIKTLTDPAKAAPMLWSGEISNDTFGGVTHDFTGPLGQRMLQITGLQVSGDALLGAFSTILKAKIGVPENLMPTVPEQMKTAILDHFAELYEAFQGSLGQQNVAVQGYMKNEAAGWAAHDEEQLAQMPTPTSALAASHGPVSDEAFERTKQTILQAHAGDPDGGAQILVNYAASVMRTITMEEIAMWTGKSVTALQSLDVKTGTGTASNTDLSNAVAGLVTDMTSVPPGAIVVNEPMGALGAQSI
ncbi:hypothetical protein HYS30_03290, partial [Candidatus Peregrinibacteria bacterium]|nr:hypothetical protein [Candidatus Peregrinibacteria bacterium]